MLYPTCHESIQLESLNMNKLESRGQKDNRVASIRNSKHPSQVVHILYLPQENAFATSGIKSLFGLKEILIPAYLVIRDIELIGMIVSCFLDEISSAQERESTFTYRARFTVLGDDYTLTETGNYMKLDLAH